VLRKAEIKDHFVSNSVQMHKEKRGSKPLFFLAKHDMRSGSWGVPALAEANPRAAWSAWALASRGTANSMLCRTSK